MKFRNGDLIIHRQSPNRSWTRIGPGYWDYSADYQKSFRQERFNETDVGHVISTEVETWEFRPATTLLLRSINRFWTEKA